MTMSRQEVRDLLQQGYELDGLVLDTRGVVLARGKVQIEGATLLGLDTGTAVALQLQYRGKRYDAPLHQPTPIRKAKPFEIQFAKGAD